MTSSEFHHIIESLNGLSPDQVRQLRQKLDGQLKLPDTERPAGEELGSIGAMREDAEFLDEVVAAAMKARQEQPWRLSPGE